MRQLRSHVPQQPIKPPVSSCSRSWRYPLLSASDSRKEWSHSSVNRSLECASPKSRQQGSNPNGSLLRMTLASSDGPRVADCPRSTGNPRGVTFLMPLTAAELTDLVHHFYPRNLYTTDERYE